MSKPRWHPLPIDSQVVAAIEDRKEKFIESVKNMDLDREEDVSDRWAFNHICTVLDHAKKIFELPEDEFCNPTFVEKVSEKIVNGTD